MKFALSAMVLLLMTLPATVFAQGASANGGPGTMTKLAFGLVVAAIIVGVWYLIRRRR